MNKEENMIYLRFTNKLLIADKIRQEMIYLLYAHVFANHHLSIIQYKIKEYILHTVRVRRSAGALEKKQIPGLPNIER